MFVLTPKVENILKGTLDLIPSPSHLTSVKIQNQVLLGFKGKTLLGVANKLLKTNGILLPTLF